MKMNIQKSRLAALLSVMLIVCMMTAMLAIPVSAAEVSTVAYDVNNPNSLHNSIDITTALLKYFNLNLNLEGMTNYYDIASYIYEKFYFEEVKYSPDIDYIFLGANDMTNALDAISGQFPELQSEIDDLNETLWDYSIFFDGAEAWAIPYVKYSEKSQFELGSIQHDVEFTIPDAPASSGSAGLADVINADMINSVTDEVVNLLPVVIGVIIGYVGLRKALSFLQSVLHSA